jgi:hypothetical protein
VKSIAFLSLLIASLALLSRPAHAQSGDAPKQGNDATRPLLEVPRPAQGYYFSLGLHGAMANVRDDGDFVAPRGGFSGALHLGQSVTTWMDLGVALEVGALPFGNRTGLLASFGMDWTLHPWRESFARLGAGMGVSRLSAAPNSDNRASSFGSVLGLTLGYAWFPFAEPRQSGGFALSPVLRVSAVQAFGEDAAFWTMIGFEVTRWTGLPQRQLDLPLEHAFPPKRR